MRPQHLALTFFAGSGDVATDEGDDRPMSRHDLQFNIYSTNITCGRNAIDSAGATATADVLAGSEIGFRISATYREDALTLGIFHAGPAQAYLTKAPNGDLSTFSGIDADWVKVAFIGASDDTHWITDTAISVNFTIPERTPPGEYLLRFEQFWPGVNLNVTQFYVNCAHINVLGNGGGSFSGYDYAKFPGTYDIMDPGLWISWDIGNMRKLLSYIPPGPPVWRG